MSPKLLIFGFILATVTGELILEIIKHQKSFKTPVLNVLEVPKNSNFTLECQVVNTKTKSRQDFDDAVWGKVERSNLYSGLDARDLIKNNIAKRNLEFIRIGLEDQGEYICASPKYNLLKTVELEVKFERDLPVVDGKFGNRFKRSNGFDNTHNTGEVVHIIPSDNKQTDVTSTSKTDFFSSWPWIGFGILVVAMIFLSTRCCTRCPDKTSDFHNRPIHSSFNNTPNHHFSGIDSMHHNNMMHHSLGIGSHINDSFHNGIGSSHIDSGTVNDNDGFSSRILMADNTNT